ncbi:MAG: glycosyltransferase family 4 protein [Candidatus Brocadia sp.]|nr:glycosyltransferase [Candidatus Brocadia sp.]MCE7911851.1 glycosyltransferase family 4 protein [Candidatus Brocadia sp. AMX3]MDG5997549.1 glycosyltransferase family 4 protein [Candidatus Brocadia sp.]RIK02103.1 MAG: glycosyltransferase family 4 protein [Candidatus Brocadia sp.]
MRVAIVHDWLTGMRGGEKVLEIFCEIFPDADVFTLIHLRGSVSKIIEERNIQTSFLQKIPLTKRHYRSFLMLFPLAIEGFDMGAYDLVLSSSHCVAKGILTSATAVHVCYCHTPMRYVWDQYQTYFGAGQKGLISKVLMPPVAHYLRMWDVTSSERVDYFVANSYHVANRIKKYYKRLAEVIHPPVDCSLYTPQENYKEGNYYLLVSAFAPYKRIDIAIEAFERMGLPLILIGEGQEERRIRKMAKKHVQCIGWQSSESLREYYRGCKALIFPGEEDFGIVPLEAQACGKPVIAFARGGALETVHGVYPSPRESPAAKTLIDSESPTGVFFTKQTPGSLMEAVRFFEQRTNLFDPRLIRKHAENFDRSIFKEKFKQYIEKHLC